MLQNDRYLKHVMYNAELANLIQTNLSELTSAWIEAVRLDPRILSDADLSEDGLRNHIPAVIEEICDLMRAGEVPTTINTREARVHAYIRFRQGYRARELVRELSLLRMTLLDFVEKSLLLTLQIETYTEAARLINLYVDEEMSYAVSVYAEVMRSTDDTQ